MQPITPKTKDEARQYAIDWQNYMSDKSMSWQDVVHYQDIFSKIAVKFHLVREFKENGII